MVGNKPLPIIIIVSFFGEIINIRLNTVRIYAPEYVIG